MKDNQYTNHLFVALPILQTVTTTSAWLFSHVAYFAGKYGHYNTKKNWASNVQNRTGIGERTYKKALANFVERGWLIKNDHLYTFNKECIALSEVFVAYEKLGGRRVDTDESLIEVDPRACNPDNMVGKKAEHERTAVTAEAIAYNKAAANKELAEIGAEFEVSTYAWLGKYMGIDWRTAKKLLHTLTHVRRTFEKAEETFTNVRTLMVTQFKSVANRVQFKIYQAKCKRYKDKRKNTIQRFNIRDRLPAT